MRRTIVIVLVVMTLILIALLYGLVFLMSTGADGVSLGGQNAARIQFANLAFLVMLVLPCVAVLAWLFDVPRRLGRMHHRANASKALNALQTALLAHAAGDYKAARRAALAADQKLDGAVGARVIAAQASEQMGDLVGAESQYAAMLANPQTERVGRRGLAAAALQRGDYETAILNAAQGFEADPNARWAFELLFDAQIRAARWQGALDTLKAGRRRDHVGEAVYRRRQSVLTAALAQSREHDDPPEATDLAVKAAKLSPDFAPAAALAARLLVKADKGWKAANLLEASWSAAPHPALALAYRDLKGDEEDTARAKRLRGLAELKPAHRESALLRAEAALSVGDAAEARTALAPFADAPDASERLCTLMARTEAMEGQDEAARTWATRALGAPEEADWSDLDPEGPAFAYTDADWARLVYSFGDRGVLIHPRHERFERHRLGHADLPRLLAAPSKEEAAASDADDGEDEDRNAASAPASTADNGGDEAARLNRRRSASRDARARKADEAETTAPLLPPSPDDPGVGGEETR